MQSLSSVTQKRVEAEALIRIHGMSVEEACDIVCLHAEEYRKNCEVQLGGKSSIKHLPTPEQVWTLAADLRRSRHIP